MKYAIRAVNQEDWFVGREPGRRYHVPLNKAALLTDTRDLLAFIEEHVREGFRLGGSYEIVGVREVSQPVLEVVEL